MFITGACHHEDRGRLRGESLQRTPAVTDAKGRVTKSDREAQRRQSRSGVVGELSPAQGRRVKDKLKGSRRRHAHDTHAPAGRGSTVPAGEITSRTDMCRRSTSRSTRGQHSSREAYVRPVFVTDVRRRSTRKLLDGRAAFQGAVSGSVNSNEKGRTNTFAQLSDFDVRHAAELFDQVLAGLGDVGSGAHDAAGPGERRHRPQVC